MEKKRVGVLTTLYEFNSSYSLCSVIESQLISLVKYGYSPVLFVHDNFKDDEKVPKGVEIRKVIPRFLLVDYSDFREPSPELEEQARKVQEVFKEHLKDIDIILEHDLIFQGWFMPYAVAIHNYANTSDIRWFHWIHSVPTPQPAGTKYPHTLRYSLPRNSTLVYLNNFHLIRAAETYQTYPHNVKIVHNPVDPRMFLLSNPLVKSIVDKYDLLSVDIVQTYPLSTPRMIGGKQLDMVIEVFAKLKRLGASVRLIVCNAHANDRREKQLIAETMSLANQKGLNSNELIFTSLEDAPKYELGVEREVVSQLFQLSNLFIFPSASENCSLVLLEAMLTGSLLILNEDVGSMREFGAENALYFKFGSIDNKVEYNNREAFMEDVAKIISSEMKTNRIIKQKLRAKQNFNYDKIFREQIEPLFFNEN